MINGCRQHGYADVKSAKSVARYTERLTGIKLVPVTCTLCRRVHLDKEKNGRIEGVSQRLFVQGRIEAISSAALAA